MRSLAVRPILVRVAIPCLLVVQVLAPDAFGQQKVNLPLPSGSDVSHFAWEPGGRALLYLADEAAFGATELFRVELGPGGARSTINDPLDMSPGVEDGLDPIEGQACVFEPGTERVLYHQTTVYNPFVYTSGVVSATLGGDPPPLGLCGGFGLVFARGGRVAYQTIPSQPFRQVWSRPTDASAPQVRLNPGVLGSCEGIEPVADGSRLIQSFRIVNPALTPWGLYSAPIDGSAAPVLLSSDGNPQRSTLSFQAAPVGERVVYVADDAVDDVYELWSVPADGSAAPVRLHPPLAAPRRVSAFRFTPDGERVVFSADVDTPGLHDLFVVPVEGGVPVRLNVGVSPALRVSTSSGPIQPTVDGTCVVFKGLQDGDSGVSLWVVPLDASAPPVQLVSPASWLAVSTLRFSLDGRRMVYDVSPSELWCAAVDGSTAPVRITPPMVTLGRLATVSGAPAFQVAPGGRHVYYLADQDTDEIYELYRVPTDGSLAATRCNGTLVPGGDVLSFAMGPTGARVAYLADQETDGVSELWLTEFPSDPRARLPAPPPGASVQRPGP